MSELPLWAGARRVGIDCETCDPQLTQGGPGGRGLGPGVRRGGYVIGISFAIEDGPKHYLPIAHRGGDNMDKAKVIQYLKDQAKVFTGDICGANLSYDLDYLAELGIVFWHCRFRDVQVAEPLLNENRPKYSLETLAQIHGFPAGKFERVLKEAAQAYHLDPKEHMWKLPARLVGQYAIEDADLPLKILRKQEHLIENQGLNQIYDLECNLLPVLVKMRRKGVRLDFDHIARVEAWTIEQEQLMLDEVFRNTNVRIGLNEINQKTLTAAALDAAGLPYGATPTGQPKIDTALLLPLAKSNKVASAIIHAKYLNKLRNTFVASLRAHETNGRIHTTFNQLKRQEKNSDTTLGAGPGRLSCSNPNEQQQPGRLPPWWKLDVPVHIFWRKCYIPDEDGRWAAMDFSGQEPRMMVHYASLCNSPGADKAVYAAHHDPEWDFHDSTTEMAFGATRTNTDAVKFKHLRGQAKIIFLGLVYGMGGGKLCHSLGFPVEMITINRGGEDINIEVAGSEGKAFLEEFNRRVPFLQDLKEKVTNAAWNKGYIKTLLGRHIHYVPGKGDERKALNNLIQGSSADQMKRAMVEIDKAGYTLSLQIHDECDTTIYNEKEAQEIADIMINCVPLAVPSKVDIEIGSSWGNSMEKK
jgi:DNA polymerase I-like protein with 3'-5' exonuclease and polymerase domains